MISRKVFSLKRRNLKAQIKMKLAKKNKSRMGYESSLLRLKERRVALPNMLFLSDSKRYNMSATYDLAGSTIFFRFTHFIALICLAKWACSSAVRAGDS